MAQSWTGVFHRAHSFEAAASEQSRQLEQCVRASGGVGLVAFVSGALERAAFRKAAVRCIRNDYYHYVSNSLYGVHLRHWLDRFEPERCAPLRNAGAVRASGKR